MANTNFLVCKIKNGIFFSLKTAADVDVANAIAKADSTSTSSSILWCFFNIFKKHHSICDYKMTIFFSTIQVLGEQQNRTGTATAASTIACYWSSTTKNKGTTVAVVVAAVVVAVVAAVVVPPAVPVV